MQTVSLQRGHSTPHMAGKFANEIGARRLVLNHLGGRYGCSCSPGPTRVIRVLICEIYRFPAPGRGGNRDNEFRENVMDWIEQQATEAWAPEESDAKAKAAVDFMTVSIKPVPFPVPSRLGAGEPEPQVQWAQQPSSSTATGQSSGQSSRHGRVHGRYTGGPPTPSNEKVPRKRQRTEGQGEQRKEDAVE